MGVVREGRLEPGETTDGQVACQGNGILIVDDDDGVRNAIQTVLEDEGFTVVAAENGRQALHVLRTRSLPCLILLDLMMPQMNGFDVAEALRGDAAWSAVPVVVVTAAHAPVVSGAVRVMRKPLRISDLIAVAREHCRHGDRPQEAAGEALRPDRPWR
jgi:CheY-like chemotaxis protein